MKNQIRILGALLFLSFTNLANAQEYKFNMREGTLKIVEVDKVIIKGTTGSEVILKSNNEKALPERAQGLKSINGNGMVDNTGFGLTVKDEDGGKAIYQVSRTGGDVTISVPSSVKLHITHSGNQGGGIEISNFEGEVEIDTRYNSITLNDVTGPVLANTIYGKIEAVFSTLSNKDMSLVSSYGLVDIAIPSSTKANLDMKSSYGDIYTDFDIQFDKVEDGMRPVKSSKITGKINGGGTNLYLQASYGNIYLRSK